MRGIGWLLVAALLFAFLPPDAQQFAVAVLRPLWLSDGGRVLLLGLAGGAAGGLLVYGVIWNSAMESLYHEDLKRADETYQRRKK